MINFAFHSRFATALLAACLTLPSFNAVAELFTSVGSTPPRQCALGNGIAVVSGPDVSGNPSASFPYPLTCPGVNCPVWAVDSVTQAPLSGQFLQWDYLFTFPGTFTNQNISPLNSSEYNQLSNKVNAVDGHLVIPPVDAVLYLTASSDTSILVAQPSPITLPSTCGVSSDPGTGQFDCESHILSFPVLKNNGYQQKVSFITPVGYAPRLASAGAKLGGGVVNYCLIAGPSVVTNVNQAAVQSEVVSLPGCNVVLTRDASGNVADAQLTSDSNPANCTIFSTPASYICDSPSGGNCKQIVSPLPSNGLTTEGSCEYSFPSGSGGGTTVKCTTCCVRATTKTCVLKSSLTSPQTQCTPGSYP